METERAFNKIQKALMINAKQLGMEGSVLNLIKGSYQKLTSDAIHTSW